jgi:hypothetical protein
MPREVLVILKVSLAIMINVVYYDLVGLWKKELQTPEQLTTEKTIIDIGVLT